MKKALHISFGFTLTMVGLWGGSYAMDVFGWDDWRKFPTFLTAMLMFWGGAFMTVWGACQ